MASARSLDKDDLKGLQVFAKKFGNVGTGMSWSYALREQGESLIAKNKWFADAEAWDGIALNCAYVHLYV